jgi:hypothetical protein
MRVRESTKKSDNFRLSFEKWGKIIVNEALKLWKIVLSVRTLNLSLYLNKKFKPVSDLR